MIRGRPDKRLSRFQRIALVLSGGGALGAYQAGVYAALEKCAVRPNWIAGSAIGAVNAAIIAGNVPHERTPRLEQFWREISRRTTRAPRRPTKWGRKALTNWLRLGHNRTESSPLCRNSVISALELRQMIGEAVDFDRLNSGTVRVVLGAVNLVTGAETFFDNDRHVLGLDHVLAGTAFPGLPPVTIDRQVFGGSAVSVSALDEARPADTLCFVVDGYDPAPGRQGGFSRSARDIAAMRRSHDLRRMIALLGERVPSTLHGDVEVRRCLSEGSNATMTILHLVHEGSATDLVAKMQDCSPASVTRRWKAGENDAATSLAHPRWLAPPSGVSGLVVHEVRGGIAASPH